MPRNKISDIIEDGIVKLLHQGQSQRQIVNVLKSDGINVALRKIGRQRNSTWKIPLIRECVARTASMVKQVSHR